MVELGVLLRRRDAEDPLFPLVVVRDGSDVQGEVASGERMLSEAVIHAAAADVAVQPVIRVDFNIANGIVRAAKEERISTVVLGWAGPVSAGQFILGTIADQVLERSLPRVLVARLVHPLPLTRRVVVALPPFVEHEPGFNESLAEIKRLAKALDAELILLSAASGGADHQKYAARITPDVPTKAEVLPSWGRVRNHLLADFDDRDLLVLFSAREGTAAWQPGLDRLPRLLAARMPGANFLIVYPPLPGQEDGGSSQVSVTGTLTFPRVEGIVLEGADLAVESAVEELVALMPDIGDQSHHLQAGLLTDAREYATCLVPGAVLLHAHTPLVAQVSLLVGIAPAGVRFPKQDDAIDLIFVLLSPSAQAPQEHLRRLAAIAHLVRRADSLTALRAAPDAKAIRTVVTEATD